MRVGCIIQARLGSTRLPRKVLEDIGGWPMIRHVWERVMVVNAPTVIMTPPEDVDEILQATNRRALVEGCKYNPSDMLEAYLVTAKKHGFDAIMRITGDCPLIDPDECNRVLLVYNSGHYDYVANDVWPSYPDGLGCEVFARVLLEEATRFVKPNHPADREHVTPWIKRGLNLMGGRRFFGCNLRCHISGLENLKFSVDTQEDLERVRAIDVRLPQGHLKFSLESTLEAWGRAGYAEIPQ